MFNTIFDIDKDGNVFMQDKSIALCPDLFAVYKHKRMGSDMVRWICAVYDYKSPYRNLPFDERVKVVTVNLFGKEKHSLCNDELVLKAIEEFKKLQYHPLIEQYYAMRDKMNEKTKVYRSTPVDKTTINEINNLEVELEKSAQSIEKIKALILKDMESDTKIGGKDIENLSILEMNLRLKDNG